MKTGKAAGAFILISFLAMSASVLCLAAVQASAMGDCSASHGIPAVCQFMSASLPAVLNNLASTEQFIAMILLVIVSFAIAFGSIGWNAWFEKLLVHMRRLRITGFESHSNDLVSNLISRGILHSRVFAF